MACLEDLHRTFSEATHHESIAARSTSTKKLDSILHNLSIISELVKTSSNEMLATGRKYTYPFDGSKELREMRHKLEYVSSEKAVEKIVEAKTLIKMATAGGVAKESMIIEYNRMGYSLSEFDIQMKGNMC